MPQNLKKVIHIASTTFSQVKLKVLCIQTLLPKNLKTPFAVAMDPGLEVKAFATVPFVLMVKKENLSTKHFVKNLLKHVLLQSRCLKDLPTDVAKA